MSTVNIIMATYNGEKYISEQIESILASAYTDWSLFIFDDGSKDATVSIAREYERKFSERIRVYQNEHNLGLTMNFLNGLKQVYDQSEHVTCSAEDFRYQPSSSNHAQYYMFSDQDDVWHKDKILLTLERMRYMEKKYGKEKPQLVFTDANVVDEKLEKIYHSFFRSQCLVPYHSDLSHMLIENKCIGCTIMMNRSLVGNLKKIPEKARLHDWWVGLVASGLGHISYLPSQTISYRQHGNNVVGGTSFFEYATGRLRTLTEQRKKIQACVEQAEEFLNMYGDTLRASQREKLTAFVELSHANAFKKRYLILRYGFFKSGFLRNIGLLLII